MQLGKILEGETETVRGKPVTFRVLGTDKEGNQVSAKAEAVFVFVDEDAREKHRQKAREWLSEHDYKDKPIPAAVLDEEENRWFLLAALRDADNPARAFCPEGQYEIFRKSIIARQLTWLFEQYGKFVDGEFPELATKEQQQQLVEEAVGK